MEDIIIMPQAKETIWIWVNYTLHPHTLRWVSLCPMHFEFYFSSPQTFYQVAMFPLSLDTVRKKYQFSNNSFNKFILFFCSTKRNFLILQNDTKIKRTKPSKTNPSPKRKCWQEANKEKKTP